MSEPNRIISTTSTEFMTLCQSQISLLTQGLGASWSAVYVTEGLVENAQAKLIPVVIYPEKEAIWQKDLRWQVLPEVWQRLEEKPRLPSAALPKQAQKPHIDSPASERQEQSLSQRHQVVLPLMYENAVVGLLVTGRTDREWNQQEYSQIETIARSIAIARLLDQRQAWYQQQLKHQQKLRRIEQDRLDDILHQLRNPITALRTFSKLLLKRLLPDDRNQTVAQSMLRESEHLQDLVQQFASEMDSSSTDPRTLTLKPAELFLPEKFTTVSNSDSVLSDRSLSLEATKLKEIIEPLLVSASTIAQERHIDFSFHIWPNLPPVRANAGAVREVLSNLIDNALKYTPAGGKVEIEAGIEQPTAGGNWQGISVSDTGSGIPSEDIDRIFERHYRGIQARGDIPGSGLGLAIAKELIEQMHGKIELISPNRATHNVSLAKDAAAGSGTTFIVWLPVARDEKPLVN